MAITLKEGRMVLGARPLQNFLTELVGGLFLFHSQSEIASRELLAASIGCSISPKQTGRRSNGFTEHYASKHLDVIGIEIRGNPGSAFPYF
jgi:hypothetical protein